jgi:soluble lytic murein transglycosylase-like protein
VKRNGGPAKLLLVLACNALTAVPLGSPAFARSAPPATGLLSEFNRQFYYEECRTAARTAELRLRLPPGILSAIGQVESARLDVLTHRVAPWPWTVQAEGKGLYFETKAEAIAWVKDAESAGIASIDAGCLQVNLYYHPEAFESLDAAFDPQRNADYAGRFLRQLYAESGDWRTAVGLYHSRTTTLSMPYQDRVAHALRDADPAARPFSGQLSVVGNLVAAWRSTLPAAGDAQPVRGVNDWNAASSGPAFPLSTRLIPQHGRLIDSK